MNHFLKKSTTVSLGIKKLKLEITYINWIDLIILHSLSYNLSHLGISSGRFVGLIYYLQSLVEFRSSFRQQLQIQFDWWMWMSKKRTQPPMIYSKPIMETLDKAWKLFKVNNKDTRATPLRPFWCLCYLCEFDVVLVSLLLTLNWFKTLL